MNVTLRANYTDLELPYTAELSSHYADGAKLSRSITGEHREEGMMDVVPEFGPIYYTGNFSLVPTTTTTTTTAAPTTVTQKTTRVNKVGSFNGQDGNDPDAVGSNVIDSKKGDDGMQSDGGPLSLKNKVDSQNGARGVFSCQNTMIFIILGILVPLLRDLST